MKPLLVEQFIDELCSVSEENFKTGTIYDFLTARAVEKESLKPYLFFSKKFYTRNLIFKNNLFELMALCWEPGQVSRIHNHAGQNCWMTVPFGKLRIQDFRVVEINSAERFCRIEPTGSVVIDSWEQPVAEVDPGEPVHQVQNPEEFKTRAVSLHIYSKPFDSCLVYTPEKNQVQEVKLFYTSMFGQMCEGIKL